MITYVMLYKIYQFKNPVSDKKIDKDVIIVFYEVFYQSLWNSIQAIHSIQTWQVNSPYLVVQMCKSGSPTVWINVIMMT